jgi:iron complex transport system ATP-binding protein
MQHPLLQARDLTFAYGDTQVLRGASLTLAAGEVVTLLGPNGSGKSTLIRVLLGQLRASGEILWDARDVRRWPRRELAKTIAYLPQTPAFEPQQTVRDVLSLGRAPYWGTLGVESAQDAHVIRNVAALLHLEDVMTRRVDQLSGGQRQRVFVGRCLVQEPRALLLDEPSTFLDLRHQVDLLQLLRTLAREQNVAVLLASHDLNVAASLSDRLILLDQGTVAASGSADEVLKPDILQRVYGVEMDRIERGAGLPPAVLPRVARAIPSRQAAQYDSGGGTT